MSHFANDDRIERIRRSIRCDDDRYLFRRVPEEPNHALKVQALDGSWFEKTPIESVDVSDFGAKPDDGGTGHFKTGRMFAWALMSAALSIVIVFTILAFAPQIAELIHSMGE